MKKIARSALAVLLTAMLSSCTNPFITISKSEADQSTTSVTLDKSEMKIGIGETGQLTVSVSPDSLSCKDVYWTSSDESVFSVANGTVTGISAGNGLATVTTVIDSRTSSCAVQIAKRVTIVFDSQGGSSVNKIFCFPGDEIMAPSSPSYEGYAFAGWYTDSACTSAVNFVTNSDGYSMYTVPVVESSATAATITFYAKWITDGTSVTVSYNYSGHGTDTDISSATGNTITLPTPAAVSGYTFCGWYTSSDFSSVCYAAGSDFTVTGAVTFYAKWIEAESTVAVTGVSLNKSEVSLTVGNTVTLTAEVLPSDATNTAVTWSSSNTSAASVSSAGEVTGIAAGSAEITATTSDGNYKASCTVTVAKAKVAVTGVTLSSSSLTLAAGETTSLTATVTPSDAADTSVAWSSDNTAVAAVSDGTVTAVASGTAVITVTTTDGAYKVSCTVTVTKGLSSISLSAGGTLYEGKTTDITVTAAYSDSSTADVSSDAVLAIDNTAVASISGATLTGVAASNTVKVTASYTYGGTTKTATLSVPVNFYGIRILTATSLGYGNIHYWSCSDKTTYPNTTWPGTDMSAGTGSPVSTSDYYYDFAGASAVSLLITNDSGAKLCGTDMAVSEMGVYRVTSSGCAKVTSSSVVTSNLTIYVKSSSVPTIWVWENGGNAVSTLMGYTWTSQPSMSATVTGDDITYNDGTWWKYDIAAKYLSGKPICFMLNAINTVTYSSDMTSTFWYDGTKYYSADPTTVPEPVAPSVTIKPASTASLPLKGSIVVTLDNGYDTISEASVTVSGAVTKAYTYSDFTDDSLTIKVSSLTSSASQAITVSASVKNSKGTGTASVSYTTADVASDVFTWDNALVYFVMTDRFYDGDTTNDHSYYRVNNSTDSSVPDVATFHGGDIAGLTAKLDYLDSLGVNAIWITAPYEQVHGWVSGKNDKFPHYSFHGYYTLDWTEMDKNMGTVEEFRTFVDAAHAKGIRVVMDIVMNHTGYNTVEDMITYNFGSFSGGTPSHGWIASTDGTWQANTNGTWSVLWGSDSDTSASGGQGWQNWWQSWVRAFSGKYGYQTPGGSNETMSLAGLPDLYTESTTADDIPVFLAKKWSDEGTSNDSYRVPAASDLRQTISGYAPHDYTEHWLASWVREFGIDGFRVDTAKHVERARWGELKDLCEAALSEWRADTKRSASSTAKSWDEGFWMTGECWGWSNSVSGEYYTTGKFDSMINFALNGSQWGGSGTSGTVPTTSTWESYASLINSSASDSDGNGNHNNMLTYVSSHDTGLCRPSDEDNLGTMLCLLPGGVQIFYGDETARPAVSDYYGDTDMATRGDMNWSSYDASVYSHWCKVGTFRKNHPAVGAGTQTTIASGTTYGRTYSGTAGDDAVVIYVGSSASTVSVGSIFSSGTKVKNEYNGETASVGSDGTVTFATSCTPVLIGAAE